MPVPGNGWRQKCSVKIDRTSWQLVKSMIGDGNWLEIAWRGHDALDWTLRTCSTVSTEKRAQCGKKKIAQIPVFVCVRVSVQSAAALRQNTPQGERERREHVSPSGRFDCRSRQRMVAHQACPRSQIGLALPLSRSRRFTSIHTPLLSPSHPSHPTPAV